MIVWLESKERSKQPQQTTQVLVVCAAAKHIRELLDFGVPVMRDGKPRRRTPRTQVQTEDGVQPPKRGEIAHLLHMDMAAHRKKTAEFNDGWKARRRPLDLGTGHSSRTARTVEGGHMDEIIGHGPGGAGNLCPSVIMEGLRASPLVVVDAQRALRVASIGLAIVSLLKAVEKAREGDSGWQERGLTAANAGLICAWVAKIDENAENGSLLPCHTAAFALSLYQMVAWWTSRQGGTHVDFPVAVILFIVVLASVASMKSTLHAVDNAFRASGALADKVDIRHR